MQQVNWSELSAQEQLSCLQRPSISSDRNVKDAVNNILSVVQDKGDEAVTDFTQQFDRVAIDDLGVSQENETLDQNICAAIDTAYNNIKTFHKKQGFQPYSVETMDGVQCQRVVQPIERVGLYVPGGTAPLVSTTLMLGVLVQITGCKEVVMCTPCNKEGKINPYILYAAKLCGIEKIYRIGGAQAIAAMAYGTETILKVDKIFGPGNAYVTEAKMQVSRDSRGAAIDMPAGPSEVCVITNETTNPVFAAADLLSQAEHDVMSQVLLIGTSQSVLNKIQEQIDEQLTTLSRQEIAKVSLENSRPILAKDMNQAIEISNSYAPEHLILCFDDASQYINQITNAGSIFVGQWTPESAGDYASGTNHVLPTYGYARTCSGLTVEAFQKTMTVQEISQEGLKNLGPSVEALANLEGLNAHERAVSLRLKEIA